MGFGLFFRDFCSAVLNWVRCIYHKEQACRGGSIKRGGSRAEPGANCTQKLAYNGVRGGYQKVSKTVLRRRLIHQSEDVVILTSSALRTN